MIIKGKNLQGGWVLLVGIVASILSGCKWKNRKLRRWHTHLMSHLITLIVWSRLVFFVLVLNVKCVIAKSRACICEQLSPSCGLRAVFQDIPAMSSLRFASLLFSQAALPHRPSPPGPEREMKARWGDAVNKVVGILMTSFLLPFPLLPFWHSNNDPTGFAVWHPLAFLA